MEIVAICQEMGWTYPEYLEQPSWFLELVRDKFILDGEELKKQMRKSK